MLPSATRAWTLAWTLALVPALAAAFSATPASAADYYAGKTIELLVGAPPGGGYDIYARAVARHFGRHIPGTPTIVVKNMPGAIMGPLLDDRTSPMFDPTKIRYVGTANSGTRVCATLKGSKIGSFADAQKVKAKFGGSSPNDSTYEYGYLHKHTSGAIYDMVSGYRGTNEMALAMERGEIDGLCGWDWSSLKSQKPDWLRDGKANVLLQVSIDPHPELTKMGVPTVFEFVKDAEARKVVELVISQTVFHRSYIAPPETPPAQLDVLRKAFDATMVDKEFLAEAEKSRIDIEPLSGAKVQEVVAKLYAAPPAIVDRARKAIRPD